MLTLVYKDFVALRRQIFFYIGIVGFFTLMMVVSGEVSGAVAYLTAWPVVFAVSLSVMAFSYEERGEGLAYLRTLPIAPSVIVGSKYLFTAMVILLFELLPVLFLAFVPGEMGSLAVLAIPILAAAFLSSFNLLVLFWLGLKTGQAAIAVLTGLLVPVGILMPRLAKGGRFDWLGGIVALGNNVIGLLAALGIAALCMMLSWALATRIFTRRDLSRMP